MARKRLIFPEDKRPSTAYHPDACAEHQTAHPCSIHRLRTPVEFRFYRGGIRSSFRRAFHFAFLAIPGIKLGHFSLPGGQEAFSMGRLGSGSAQHVDRRSGPWGVACLCIIGPGPRCPGRDRGLDRGLATLGHGRAFRPLHRGTHAFLPS